MVVTDVIIFNWKTMQFQRASKSLYFVAVLGALYSGAAHAGRPLVTDDAGFIDQGGWEVEGSIDRASEADSRTKGYSLGVAYGIGFNTQLGVGVGRSKTDAFNTDGVGLSGKTGLWSDDAGAGLSLAYSLDWSKEAGAKWVHTGSGAGLIYSRPLVSGLTLHTNLLHVRDEVAGMASTGWGVALEHEGFGSLAPMAEVFGDDRSAPWWNVGLRWTVKPKAVFLDVSYGAQLATHRPDTASVGLKLAF